VEREEFRRTMLNRVSNDPQRYAACEMAFRRIDELVVIAQKAMVTTEELAEVEDDPQAAVMQAIMRQLIGWEEDLAKLEAQHGERWLDEIFGPDDEPPE